VTVIQLCQFDIITHWWQRKDSIEQESATVDMVVANNAIRLCEIHAVIADQGTLRNISVSWQLDRVLRRNHVRIKQLAAQSFILKKLTT